MHLPPPRHGMLEHYATCQVIGRDTTRSRATNETIAKKALRATDASIFRDSWDERSLNRIMQRKRLVRTLAGFTKRFGLDARQNLPLNMSDARINLSPLLISMTSSIPLSSCRGFLTALKDRRKWRLFYFIDRNLPCVFEMNFELEKREINLYIEDNKNKYV